MTIPIILTVGSVILLSVFFFTGRRIAVWGGATLGLIIGVVVGLVRGDLANSVMWGVSIGTFAGFGGGRKDQAPELRPLLPLHPAHPRWGFLAQHKKNPEYLKGIPGHPWEGEFGYLY